MISLISISNYRITATTSLICIILSEVLVMSHLKRQEELKIRLKTVYRVIKKNLLGYWTKSK